MAFLENLDCTWNCIAKIHYSREIGIIHIQIKHSHPSSFCHKVWDGCALIAAKVTTLKNISSKFCGLLRKPGLYLELHC